MNFSKSFSKNLLVFTFLSISLIASLNIAAVDRAEREAREIRNLVEQEASAERRRAERKALSLELTDAIKNRNSLAVKDILKRGATVEFTHKISLKDVRAAVEADLGESSDKKAEMLAELDSIAKIFNDLELARNRRERAALAR